MNRGFTLVELIITIVLLGIVAGVGVNIISRVFIGYSDSKTKNFLYNEGKFAAERIDREIRESVPNTLRIHNSSTLQFALFSDMMYYDNTTINKINIYDNDSPLSIGDNVSIYITSSSHFYNLSRVYNVTGVNNYDNYSIITFDKNISKDSPYKRLFVVETPVTFYLDGDTLKRCFAYPPNMSNYGNPDGTCNIVTKYVESVTFTYEAGVTWRTGVLTIDIKLSKAGTSITYTHKVQVRNVP